jgi:hypothetical protein
MQTLTPDLLWKGARNFARLASLAETLENPTGLTLSEFLRAAGTDGNSLIGFLSALDTIVERLMTGLNESSPSTDQPPVGN